MKPKIGIPTKQMTEVSKILSALLADEYILLTKTRNAHWNVEGRDFHAMHVFFETQYNEINEIIDEVAERLRQIGSYAPASLTEFLKLTHLSEKGIARNDSSSFIKQLLNDQEVIINFLRDSVDSMEDNKDYGTEDFLVGLLEKHEKQAWMLRASL